MCGLKKSEQYVRCFMCLYLNFLNIPIHHFMSHSELQHKLEFLSTHSQERLKLIKKPTNYNNITPKKS